MTNFLPKRISIWPDLVDLFENVTAVRFFGPPCTYTVYHYIYIYWSIIQNVLWRPSSHHLLY